jgi:transcriptional regulator with XRE-family HTH domain
MSALSNADSIGMYIEDNSQFMIEGTLSEHINRLCSEKGITKSQVIKRAEMNEIYAYQIFSGKRMPSRDKLLCLCLGMELDSAETERLLKSAGFAQLYPKSKRDSVILFGIEKKQSVVEINELLYEIGEKTLN